MKDITTLVEICRKKGQRSIQLVNQNFRKKEISKDNQLYQGIAEGRFLSDGDAANAIFKADPNSRNYRNAKGKLKHKLLNHLYFLDYEKDSYTLAQRVAYELEHQLHQSKILINEGAHEIARVQLQQVATTASNFELSDIQVAALRLLIRVLAVTGKLSQYQEVVEQLKNAQALDQAIQEAKQRYYGVIVKSNKSQSAQTKVLGDIQSVVEDIQKLARPFESNRMDVLVKKLQLLQLQLTHNYEGVLKLINKIEKQYLNVPHNQVRVAFERKEMVYNKLEAYYYSNKIMEGMAHAQVAISCFHHGDANWFQFAELYFLLMMKGEAFDKATLLYRSIRTSKNFVSQNELEKQRWQIYRAYLLFTHDHKLLRWGFNLEEFIDCPPNNSKDDFSFDVSTLIIQVMFLLRQGEPVKVEKYIELLAPYNSPHLDKRHNYRNSIFIRLLNIMVREEFKYHTVKERGSNYCAKLSNMKFPLDAKNDLEVIPYQILWKFIIDILKTNKAYLHYRFYQT